MRLLTVRLALRATLRDASYLVTCLVTVAVCVALNGAIYGLVRPSVVAPLPFPTAARTYAITAAGAAGPGAETLDRRAYDQLAARARLLETVAAYSWASLPVSVNGRRQALAAVYVTPTLLPALGIAPARGRFPGTVPDAPELAVSAALAQREGLDVGATLRVRDLDVRVAAILPEGFQFPARQDLWLPDVLRPLTGGASSPPLVVLAVARPGTPTDAVDREVRAAAAGAAAADYATTATAAAPAWRAVPYQQRLVSADARRLALLLLATGAALAALATANIAGLTAAREAARTRERTIQRALGASDSALFGELLLTVGVATAPGLLAGGWLGAQLLQLVRVRYGQQFPYWQTFTLGGVGVAYCVLLAALMALGAVAAVAFAGRRRDVAAELRDATRGRQDGRHVGRQRRAIVFVQVAFAVAVLVVTGRLVRSADAYVAQSPGFASAGLLTVRLGDLDQAPGGADAGEARLLAALARIRALPGVAAASVASSVPAAGTAGYAPVRVPALARDSARHDVVVTGAGPGFFETLGVRAVEGRLLTTMDDGPAGRAPRGPAAALAPRVGVVVNRAFQRRVLGGRDAVDASVEVVLAGDTLTAAIVGVVPDLADQLISLPVEPALYLPATAFGGTTRFVIVRARTPAASLVPAVDAVLGAELPHATTGRRAWLDDLRRELYAQEALLAGFAAVLAAAAGLLTLVGLHALLALAVARERPTAALRLALGADPRRVGAGLLAEVTGLGLLAVGAGLGLAAAASGVLQFVVFGVAANGLGPVAWTAAGALGLVLAEGVAGWWRLARADPAEVLR